jgi:hypothetical protein
MAITLHFWTHIDSRTGKRHRTRHRLTEDDAKARLIDPMRVEHGALTVEPTATTPAGHWRSGLVADGDDSASAK